MTKSETDKFLSSLKTETLLELRDKAIIYLILSTGLKKSQILNIRLNHLANFNGNYFIILKTIGKKGDIVKINSEIQDLTMLYIDKTSRNITNDGEDYLFKSHSTNKSQAEKLSPGSLNKMLNKKCKRMNIEKHLTIQSLRHTAITAALESGENINLLKRLLASSSTNNIGKYIHSIKKK